MTRRVSFASLTAVVLLALSGCAQQAVVLKPGPLPFGVGQSGSRQGPTWSLWVADARDVRPSGLSGPKVGTLYTRFRKTPETAYLEPNPEVYIREQLGRYLLSRGWEATGASAARALLYVEAEEFSCLEDPGAVWDEIKVRIVYTVRIAAQNGQELGRVKLEGGAQLTSPIDTERQLEKAFRDALADTFEAFSRSDALRNALAQLGG